MVILGVDPGLTATGYGVIRAGNTGRPAMTLLEVGTIEPKKQLSLPDKVKSIYDNLRDVVAQHRPAVMVLEKIYSHHKHPNTVSVLGHARGVICLVAAQAGVELAEHSVKRVRKALLGRGDADKAQTRQAVAHQLRIPADGLTLDASDALALAMGYALMRRVGG